MEDEEFKIEFEFDEEHPVIKLWNEIAFHSTIGYFMLKGYFMYFITMGGVEIEVGYEEDGETHHYLHLEKLW